MAGTERLAGECATERQEETRDSKAEDTGCLGTPGALVGREKPN